VKSFAKLDMNKYGKVKCSAIPEEKRNGRRRLPYEVNGGPLAFTAAFTADYYRPVHHPPKNNK